MRDLLTGAVLGVAVALAITLLLRIFPAQWRVPPRRIVAMAVLIGLILWIASDVWGQGYAAAIAALSLGAASPIFVLRARRAWKIERAIAGLHAESTRAESLAELDRLLGPPPTNGVTAYAKWARLSQHVAGGAARAGLPEEALKWLDRVSDAGLDPLTVVARAQVRAACFISLREPARARAEIARLARPVSTPLWERALVALETLLDALEGVPSAEARARAGLAAETEPNLRVTWQTAHAHALAALGHRDEATDVLRAVRDAFPKDAVLARIVRHGGPASPLAESLMTEPRSAYR